MRKSKLAVLSLGLALSMTTFSSCVVMKKKYDEEVSAKEKLAGEKRKLEKEKSELITQVGKLRADTTKMGKDYRDLLQKFNAISKQHKDLSEQSKQTTDQLRKTLQTKESELAEKERLLAEREKTVKELQDAIARKDAIVKELLSKVKGALANFNADELTVEMKNGKVYVSLAEKLLFQSGKADVDKKGKEALGKLADVLNKNTDIDVQIEGHTDNVPIKTAQFKDNWDLSVVRATSIVRILTEDYDVDATRLTPAGKGDKMPVVANDTPSNKAKNRRIEVVLSPKLDELLKLLESDK